MSKREARLPDHLERAITYLEEANCQTRDGYRNNLRDQIHLALDEARDEAIEGAQQAAFKEMTRRHAKDGTPCGTIDQACIRAAIRALKSKR